MFSLIDNGYTDDKSYQSSGLMGVFECNYQTAGHRPSRTRFGNTCFTDFILFFLSWRFHTICLQITTETVKRLVSVLCRYGLYCYSLQSVVTVCARNHWTPPTPLGSAGKVIATVSLLDWHKAALQPKTSHPPLVGTVEENKQMLRTGEDYSEAVQH